MDREATSALRKRFISLCEERGALEHQLLAPARLLRGSLLERHLLSGGVRRSSPAYYLSSSAGGGQRRLSYIRKADLEVARREVEAYRSHRKTLSRLRTLADEILQVIDALGKAQEVPPP